MGLLYIVALVVFYQSCLTNCTRCRQVSSSSKESVADTVADKIISPYKKQTFSRNFSVGSFQSKLQWCSSSSFYHFLLHPFVLVRGVLVYWTPTVQTKTAWTLWPWKDQHTTRFICAFPAQNASDEVFPYRTSAEFIFVNFQICSNARREHFGVNLHISVNIWSINGCSIVEAYKKIKAEDRINDRICLFSFNICLLICALVW